MVRKVPYTKEYDPKKSIHHWIKMSHLVAIPFVPPLLGKMLAEVRDMLDDIRVKAGWRSATYNIPQ